MEANLILLPSVNFEVNKITCGMFYGILSKGGMKWLYQQKLHLMVGRLI